MMGKFLGAVKIFEQITFNFLSFCNTCTFSPWIREYQESGQACTFRFTVSLKSKTHSFTPKNLDDGGDKMQMRSSQLGAVYKGMFEKLPCTSHARLLWEVSWLNSSF